MKRPCLKSALPLAAALILAMAGSAFADADSGPEMSVPSAASARMLDLGQALRLVEQESPLLRAAAARTDAAKQAARAVDSGYYPSVGLAAVDSTGFPGSATGLEGFDGLVASPYRKGPSADAFGTWNLVNATVWHAASAAGYEAQAGLEAERVERAQVDVRGLEVYLRAVLYRGDRQSWAALVESLKGVRDTVLKFVRNGQYSEVQRMLIQDQMDDADIRQGDYDQEYRLVLLQLALLSGQKGADFECPGPEALDEGTLTSLLAGGGESPLVLRAEDEAQAARQVAKEVEAENLPKIELGGSAGWLDQERLVQGQDNSAFAGVTMPLFEGFKIEAGEKAAEKEEEARDAERAEAQLELDDFDARMDEQIAEAREDLARLLPEQKRAVEAVDLARSRYLNFLGPLSDLQEALKDRVTVETQIAQVKTGLLLALGSKLFVNGATLSSGR